MHPPLNVLVVAQYFPPDIGGSATRAYNVARGLILNGCNVTVVAAAPHYPHGKIPKGYRWRPAKVEQQNGTRIIRTFMPPLESKGFARRILLMTAFAFSSLWALPLVGKTDAVWATSWLPGLIYGKVKRRPVTLNVDDLTLEDISSLKLIKKDSVIIRMARAVYRFFYMKGSAVTPVSLGYFDTIALKYGVERSKIHLVRGGVDLTIFKPSAKRPEQSEPFIVLYTGAFSSGYDFDQLLKAAKVVEAKEDGVGFIIQGKGERLNHIESTIRKLNLRNVRLIDKLLSREEVAALMGQADVLVLPLADYGRPYLGMSSKLYEYQATGRPIICCAEGRPAEYVKESDSGIVVKPGNYEELAEAVIQLKRNPNIARTIGKRGRDYVENVASLEAIGSEMKRVLEGLLQND